MTSLVDTRIRCFLKNKAQLIRNQGVFHSGSSPNNAVPPEILVSRLKKLDWNPGDIARELCMQIISLATSKGFSFPCSSLLISSGLEKKNGKILGIDSPVLHIMVEVSCYQVMETFALGFG